MKYKIVYQIGCFYFEAEAENEQERKDAIKGLIYATKDLADKGLLSTPKTMPGEARNIENGHDEEMPSQEEEPQSREIIEYATEGQKKYMDKLGIKYTSKTTKIEAIDLINDWKVKNGVPLYKKK